IGSRPAIPVGLPAGMGPMGAEKAGIGDERAFNRAPRVEILSFVERPDQGSGEQREEQTVGQPGPRASALGGPHATWYRTTRGADDRFWSSALSAPRHVSTPFPNTIAYSVCSAGGCVSWQSAAPPQTSMVQSVVFFF